MSDPCNARHPRLPYPQHICTEEKGHFSRHRVKEISDAIDKDIVDTIQTAECGSFYVFLEDATKIAASLYGQKEKCVKRALHRGAHRSTRIEWSTV